MSLDDAKDRTAKYGTTFVMIGRLVGIPLEQDDGSLVLDVAGVGYEVLVPIGSLGRAERASGDRVVLYVHTHVREDALILFAFASISDRIAFRHLLSVSNVGPKTAVAVLSALPGEELGAALAEADARRLMKVPGVGKKTAEMIILHLKDKIELLFPGRTATAAPPKASAGRAALVQSALTNLGYKTQDAERAVSTLGAKVAEQSVDASLRDALAILSR